MADLIVGIDIGGTKVAGGLMTMKGQLSRSSVVPTLAAKGFKTSYGQITNLIAKLLRRAGKRNQVVGIGMCAPGPLDPRKGLVISAPNLPGWRHVLLAKMVSEKFHLPAKVENDANAAGLAESLTGAAVKYRHVFYVTVSTGIGTGIIINKKVYHGKNGIAGEGGHVTIDYRSPYRCGCGTLGCIEALAAGPAMARRARVRLEQEHTTPSLLRDWTGGNLSRITPLMIEKAAARRDPIAYEIIEQTGFYLGVWLAGMITLLDPEAIVIGGGVARIGKPLFDKIRKTILQYTLSPRFAAHTPLLAAKLQKNVGVYGAASLFLPAGVKAEAEF
ncbi:MAG: ROK family protein [Acidobacteria bacterium]|nr:MAG: ROK family protein [Acidobacteriota bacterium]